MSHLESNDNDAAKLLCGLAQLENVNSARDAERAQPGIDKTSTVACQPTTLSNTTSGRISSEVNVTYVSRVDEEDKVEDPWSKLYIPRNGGFENPTPRNRAYTFLVRSSLLLLRNLGKQIGAKHYGVKNAVICYLLIRARELIENGDHDWSTVFGEDYVRFWTAPKNQTTTIIAAPDISNVFEHSHTQGNRKERGAPLSVHEFARLVGVLIEHESARNAMLRSGTDLSRYQQQRRESRDVFWDDIVETLYNNIEVTVPLDLKWVVDVNEFGDKVDANRAPPCKRTGSWLKAKYMMVRAAFTRAHSNWSVSGQIDPESSNFVHFVSREPNSTGISTLGRYCLMLFHALNCGTVNEDVEMLEYTSKRQPHVAGYDDGEACNVDDSASGGSARKRRRIIEDLASDSKARTLNIEKLTDAVCSFIGEGKKVDNTMTDVEKLYSLTKKRAELKAICADGDELTNQSLNIVEKMLRDMHRKWVL